MVATDVLEASAVRRGGSSPSLSTKKKINIRPVRIMVSTPDFHSGNRVSTTLRATNLRSN
jgi:hypothetical protein